MRDDLNSTFTALLTSDCSHRGPVHDSPSLCQALSIPYFRGEVKTPPTMSSGGCFCEYGLTVCGALTTRCVPLSAMTH